MVTTAFSIVSGVFSLTLLVLAGEDKVVQVPTEPVGIWEGTLNVGDSKLRLVFQLRRNGDKWSATMDSPDQGAVDIPLSPPIWKDNLLTLELPAAKLCFSGRLSADGRELQGTFKQEGLEVPMTLRRVAAKTAPRRPQEPKPPFPYQAVNVTYDNPKAARVKMAGTLTLPKGVGPFPAVLLISGSGQQNRDEELFGHKPFLVLADHLTRYGFAVLRYDDRGVGQSSGPVAEATTADFASDAEAGFDWLRQRPEIDARKVGLIGHSEGGLIAAMIAARRSEVAYVILLAGPGMSGAEILRHQVERLARAEKLPEADIRLRSEMQAILTKLAVELEAAEFPKQAAAALRERLQQASPAELKRLVPTTTATEITVEEVVRQIEPPTQSLTSTWMRFFLRYDPRADLQRIQCPVLALGGELDLQVAAKENLSQIERALKQSGNGDVTTVVVPQVNHLFQTAQTGSPAEYARIEETISPQVLTMMTNWLRERIRK
jgi:pimeloyl-ACP methyl ester carboxylesterase